MVAYTHSSTVLLFCFVSLLFQNGGFDYIKHEDPDIFCVQETKCTEDDLPMVSTVASQQ